jgi:dihydropteroate synthase
MNPSASPPSGSSWDQRFSGRVEVWQLRTRRLQLPRRPLVMGVVNATPESFSDGGQFIETAVAVEHALRLASAGADVIDIGGQSTRPYSQGVDAETELRRVIPLIAALRPQVTVPISIDTSKATVALEAVAAGAEIINDVSGLEADPGMLEVARQSKAGICLMHMQGTPETMQDNPTYENVVEEILAYLRDRRDHLLDAGIERARIAVDPGIGFGKTHQHNLTLLANCFRFHELGCPILVGPSRKGFIGKVTGDKSADRTAGTVGVALSLASQGVQIIRVHDVAPVRQALLLYEATGGIDGQALVLPSE